MSVVTYKCPNCGGPLGFNAESQSWKCEFCLSDFNSEEIEKISEQQNQTGENPENENTEESARKDSEFEEKARTYICSSCGAEIVTDDTTAATFCYYCHNTAILPGRLSGEYRPAKVIPFKFERDRATEMFIKWCRKKPLLSKDFTSSSQLKLLSGVYIPFWLFDCDVRGRMSAEGRQVRSWTSGNKKYTETKYFDIHRAGTASFKGVPADGSKKTEDKLVRILEPYDYNQLEDFSMSYLSGYLAEKYDIGKDEVFGGVSERIKDYTDTLLRNTIMGYSSVSVRDSSVDIYDAKATYVLLPTWMFTYNYKGKTYVFAMNGQTGKIAGNLPLSKGRMAAWFGIISAITFAITFIGGMLL